MFAFFVEARAPHVLVDHVHASKAVCADNHFRAVMVHLQSLEDADQLSPFEQYWPPHCDSQLGQYEVPGLALLWKQI